MKKPTLLLYTPFTGLGLYGGFRGNRWLRNRIKVFKQFVLPSLINQTDRDFVHWVQWRPEERDNRYVQELDRYMSAIPNYRHVFTYGGLCFWDDKFDDLKAREKLTVALKNTLPDLLDWTPDSEFVYTLLVPSDDLYDQFTVESVKKAFEEDPKREAVGFTKGYIINYTTKEVLEYNPKTNPPFFAIKFPRQVFFDPGKHLLHISLKQDVAQYKKGTPYPSHEYLPMCLKTDSFDGRGFMVGTHGENISTHFNHPYGGGRITDPAIYRAFGIDNSEPLAIKFSVRKRLLRMLPHSWQRKLRYLVGEQVVHRIYEFLRN